jgi:hypothetical protein
MLPADAKAIVPVQIQEPVEAANTADATGAWVAMPAAEGCIVFTQSIGAMTGTVDGTLETAEAANGLNNEALLPDDESYFAQVSAANNVQKKVVNARKNKGYVQWIGAIGTGPAVVSVTAEYRPKTST